jgi:hypothetical protein
MMIVILFIIAIFISLNSQIASLEFDIAIRHLPNNRNLKENAAYDLTRNNLTFYLINLNIGSPSQTFNLMLDTGSFVTWVAGTLSYGKLAQRSQYQPYKSKCYISTNESKNITYAASGVTGYVFNDVISFDNNINMKTIKLVGAQYAYPDIEIDYDGIIGLGRVYEDSVCECNSDYSILKNLYDQGVINKQIFSFKPVSDEKGKFYIGEYHSDFNKDYAKCNILEKSDNVVNLWTCKLAYILTGDNGNEYFPPGAYSQYKDFVIDSGSAMILAPLESVTYFTTGLLKETFATRECHDESQDQVSTVITCNVALDLYNMPPVYFVLNGYAIKISAKYLFIKDHQDFPDRLLFGIIFVDGLNFWTMGQPIFFENHILFDYENSLIAFYGEYIDYTQFTTDKDFTTGDYIVVIVVPIVGLISILIGIVIFCKIKKKRAVQLKQRPVENIEMKDNI